MRHKPAALRDVDAGRDRGMRRGAQEQQLRNTQAQDVLHDRRAQGFQRAIGCILSGVAGGTITGYALAPSWIEASSSALATAPTTQAATQPADDD